MINRRSFLSLSAAAVSLFALGRPATATTDKASAAEAGIIYTARHPGQWAQKAASHAPVITVTGSSVQVETRHAMSPKHYIVRHTLVLADGTVLGGTTFTPVDKPISAYRLPSGYSGIIRATSFCNLHDLWLSEHRV